MGVSFIGRRNCSTKFWNYINCCYLRNNVFINQTMMSMSLSTLYISIYILVSPVFNSLKHKYKYFSRVTRIADLSYIKWNICHLCLIYYIKLKYYLSVSKWWPKKQHMLIHKPCVQYHVTSFWRSRYIKHEVLVNQWVYDFNIYIINDNLVDETKFGLHRKKWNNEKVCLPTSNNRYCSSYLQRKFFKLRFHEIGLHCFRIIP